MKKIPADIKPKLPIYARKRHRKSLSRVTKTHAKRKNAAFKNKKPIDFVSPETLCLDKNQNATISFYKKLLSIVCARELIPVHIDFSQLKNITAGAALMLAAILYSWSRKSLKAKFQLHDISSWDSNIYFLLDQMGLFDLLPVSNPPATHVSQPNVQFLKFYTGRRVDTRQFRPFREKVQKNFGNISSIKKLYAAVVEAMTNAAQHAYPQPIPNDLRALPQAWWSFAGYNDTTNELTICFCDLGVGIPNSLPREHPMELINAILQQINVPVKDHARMIKAATMLGRTKTGQRSRGKGLPEMKQIIDANPKSNLRIYSSGGCYQYAHGGAEKLSDVDPELPGTLIEWNFVIKQASMSLPLSTGVAA